MVTIETMLPYSHQRIKQFLTENGYTLERISGYKGTRYIRKGNYRLTAPDGEIILEKAPLDAIRMAMTEMGVPLKKEK